MSCRCPTVFDRLAGTHRIQRVPANDKTGRRHTSTVTVIVLDPATATTASVVRADVDETTFRASGAGGQHRNKTDSAVRLRHRPTGIIVTATESRSQTVNRQTAWARLRAILDERAAVGAAAAVNAVRADQFDSGRSWVWCAWRDQVTGPDGQRAVMRDALRGRLARLLR